MKKKKNANMGNEFQLAPMNDVLSESDLTAQLRCLYECVAKGSVANLLINNYIPLHLHVPQIMVTKSRSPPQLREYLSLVLIEEPVSLISKLPADSSPKLIQFINAVSPHQK